MRFDRFAAVLGFALALAAAPALAEPDTGEDECQVDADCGGYGLRCLEHDYEECFSGSANQEPECYVVIEKRCGPATCATDADCTGGTACVTFAHDDCEEPCDPDDADCDGEEQDECEPVSESYCVPPWLAPCTIDADCGPGFTCEQEMECWAEGSSSGDYEEHCEPSGESRCALVETPCDTTAECGDGLTCVDLGNDCGAPPGPVDPEDAEDLEDCYEKLCLSPSFVAWSQGMNDDGVRGGADEAGGDLGGGSDAPESTGCAAAGTSAISLFGLLAAALVLRRR